MKITWEPGDLAGGRRVGKRGRVEQWMVGYVPGGKLTLVSTSDGMTMTFDSREALCAHLNEAEEWPVEMLGSTK